MFLSTTLSCQSLDLCPIASNQCFLFSSAPPFDLSFPLNRFFACGKLVNKYQLNRSASCGVTSAGSRVVLLDSLFQIIGVTDVKGIVFALQNIEKEWFHRFTPKLVAQAALRLGSAQSAEPAQGERILDRGS